MDDEQPSKAAGACVLVVLGGVALAVVWAASPEAGVLTVWGVGTIALWKAARKPVSDSSATPPAPPEPVSKDVFARETGRAREVRSVAGEGYLIFPEVEYVTDLEDSADS